MSGDHMLALVYVLGAMVLVGGALVARRRGAAEGRFGWRIRHGAARAAIAWLLIFAALFAVAHWLDLRR